MSVLFDFPFSFDDEGPMGMHTPEAAAADVRWVLVFPEETLGHAAKPVLNEGLQLVLQEAAEGDLLDKLRSLDEQLRQTSAQCRSFAAAALEELANVGFELRELSKRLGAMPNDSNVVNATTTFSRVRPVLAKLRDEAHTRVVAFDLIQKRLLELNITLSLKLRDLSDTSALETATTSGLTGMFTGIALVVSSVIAPFPASFAMLAVGGKGLLGVGIATFAPSTYLLAKRKRLIDCLGKIQIRMDEEITMTVQKREAFSSVEDASENVRSLLEAYMNHTSDFVSAKQPEMVSFCEPYLRGGLTYISRIVTTLDLCLSTPSIFHHCRPELFVDPAAA